MNLDLRNRAPRVERLPDYRLRVTRQYDVLNFVPKTPTDLLSIAWIDWGTADVEFTDCRLVAQDVAGQSLEFPDTSKRPPVLTRVYEEISQLGETQVGNPGIEYDQYDNKIVTIDFLQFSAGTALYQIPGTTAAPTPNSDAILKDETRTNDGTLQRIRRVYTTGGILADNEELKFGGRLLLRTIKSLNEIPITPTGFTLVTESTEYVRGLPLYSYGYASGSPTGGGGGEIGRDIQYNISPDQGTTGVTVTTIKYITDLAVDDNPITGPVGSELIKVDFEDREGYRVWTAVYAAGQGTITTDREIREGGKLIIYSATALNVGTAVYPVPTATIGGVVTAIDVGVRNGTDAAAGTIVYDYKWAEGNGEVSRAFTNSDGGDTEFDPDNPDAGDGAVICTIRHLTALSVTTDPTTGPAGFVRFAVDVEDNAGYRAWTVRYGYGSGLVAQSNEYRNQGRLVLYRRTSLGTAPSAPAATIGGAVTLINSSQRNASGHIVYDYAWAEGRGVYEERLSPRDGGLRLESWVSFGYEAGTSNFTPPGIPISIDKEFGDGVTRWTVTCIQDSGGGDPTDGFELVYGDLAPFTYPGRAKAYTTNIPLYSAGTGLIYDVFKSPPIEVQVECEATVTYQTSPDLGSLANPLWNPDEWATLRAYWQGLDGYAKAEVSSLFGYRAVGSPVSYTAPAYPSSVAILGINALQNSQGSISITGGPSSPDGQTYTLAARIDPAFIGLDGVQYYRKTIVTATIPTQTALPV